MPVRLAILGVGAADSVPDGEAVIDDVGDEVTVGVWAAVKEAVTEGVIV